MNTKTLTVALAALTLAAPLVAAAIGGSGSSGSNAANKTSAAGSSVEHLSADVVDHDLGLAVLTTTIKTSAPQDLLVSLSMECALWTEVISTTIDDHPVYDAFSRAEARVTAWVEFDGVPVLVSGDDPDGKVVFCDRVHEQELSDMDNSTGNHTIRQYLATRSANAFDWVVLDAGSGVHTIVVKVDIEALNTEGAFAEGAVGKRTLVVEPTRFANGFVLA